MESVNSSPTPCPECGTAMVESSFGAARVHRCPEGHGVFLPRAELGALVEAETDWHRFATQHTAPIPRITAEMAAADVPPQAKVAARAWVETLFR